MPNKNRIADLCRRSSTNGMGRKRCIAEQIERLARD